MKPVVININTNNLSEDKSIFETAEDDCSDEILTHLKEIILKLDVIQNELKFNPGALTKWQINGEDVTLGQAIMWLSTHASFKGNEAETIKEIKKDIRKTLKEATKEIKKEGR